MAASQPVVSIVKAACAMLIEIIIIRAAIDACPVRLKACAQH